jgi:hypothetical protein
VQPNDILRFLQALDAELTKHAKAGERLDRHLLAQSALILHYGLGLGTPGEVRCVHSSFRAPPWPNDMLPCGHFLRKEALSERSGTPSRGLCVCRGAMQSINPSACRGL